MIKKSKTLLLFLLIGTLTSFAQDTKKESEPIKTKMDAFTSKTGSIVKFLDYNLQGIKISYGGKIETRVRKIISGTVSSYFFQIEKSGQYSNSTASIEYLDLMEVIKAVKTLKQEVENDLASNPDYLENKFTTVDGFKVGYYISKGKINWYLKLEKYGSDNTVFIDNAELILNAFEEAKSKIEQLK
ncbi:hypothetical protein [Flavobacterium sp. N1994]|uniref:hypothetical protein n=1 Tax=Flavobacterium sp. N1994 TaxID=2986827 RepID=UPI0022217FE3|nr:hypothetical protein [Flavobacterium sp. N1994]